MNEAAIANAAPLKELKPQFTPFVRRFPDAVNSFLRFQVLEVHQRFSTKPVMNGLLQVGDDPDLPGTYHRLLGFGETLEAAQAMARRAR